MNLVFDTETSGLPLWREPSTHPGQPHLVQLALAMAEALLRVLGDRIQIAGEPS